MSFVIVISHLLAGLAVGVSLALAHLWATRRAAEAVTVGRAGATRLLLGFPIRVGVPALALFGLARVSLWALTGGALAFIVGQRLALARRRAPDR